MGVPPVFVGHDEAEELERLETVCGGLEDDGRVGGRGGGGSGFGRYSSARAQAATKRIQARAAIARIRKVDRSVVLFMPCLGSC